MKRPTAKERLQFPKGSTQRTRTATQPERVELSRRRETTDQAEEQRQDGEHAE